MRKPVLRYCVLLLFISLFIPSISSASAAITQSQLPLQSASIESFYHVSDDTVLIHDHNYEQRYSTLNAINLSGAKVMWSKRFPEIYDIHVLTNPRKIVVLTREDDKLKKIVLDEHGNTLSQQLFRNIKLNLELGRADLMIRWSPPQQKLAEQIVVLEQNHPLDKSIVSVYSSPWSKPLVRKDVRIAPNSSYEDVMIQDMIFQSPNLVIQYAGHGIMQTQYFYKIMNMSNSQESIIPIEWNIRSDFDVKDGQLIVTTNYDVGIPFGPDRKKGNLTSAVYDLNTRKQVYKQEFTFTDNDTFGWDTSYQAGQIWLHDLSDSKWSITDSFGKALIKEQTAPLPNGAHFIAYAAVEKKAYFLLNVYKEKAKLLAIEVTDAD